jgi:hypothetical protein
MGVEDHVYYPLHQMRFLILVALMFSSMLPINNLIITGKKKGVVLLDQLITLMDAIV